MDPLLSETQEERRYFWNWDGIQGEDFIFITRNLLVLTCERTLDAHAFTPAQIFVGFYRQFFKGTGFQLLQIFE